MIPLETKARERAARRSRVSPPYPSHQARSAREAATAAAKANSDKLGYTGWQTKESPAKHYSARACAGLEVSR